MKNIATQIHAHSKEGKTKDYHVVFVPRRTMICERVLEEEGMLRRIIFLFCCSCSFVVVARLLL